MNHHNNIAAGRVVGAVTAGMPEIIEIINEMQRQVERAADGNDRISRSLNRLGCPYLPMPGTEPKQEGRPVPQEGPSALDRMRDIVNSMRINANDACALADRLDQTV